MKTHENHPTRLSSSLRRREAAVRDLHNPPIVRSLFGDTRWAWLWLVVRLYLGWQWLQPGWEKLQSPVWSGNQAGVALTGFVNGALSKTSGPFPEVQGWYAGFLQSVVMAHPVLWSHAIAWGETLVGIGLIVGALTGLAAFFGFLMNFNYLLSGAVGLNPIMLLLAVLLVAAWRIAGWWGLDRWLLSVLGRPWHAPETRPKPV